MSSDASSSSDFSQPAPPRCAHGSAFSAADILNNITDAFIAMDRDWRITYVNPSYLRLVAPLHASASDLIGHILWDKFPDIADSLPGRRYRESMAAQKPLAFEVFYEPLQTWLDIRTYPSPQGLAIYASDFTERKNQELRLAGLTRRSADQTRLFDAILSNVPDLAYAFDRDLRFLYANKPLVTLLGRPLEQIVGKTCLELGYPPDLAALLESQMRQVFATGQPFQGETPLTAASGQIDHHEYIYSPAFGPDGTVTALVGITRLVTARKRSEDAVRDAERQLRLVADNASVLLAHMDREYRYKFVNLPYARRYQREPRDIVGRHAEEIVGPALFARARPYIDRALAGEEIEFELDITLPGRETRWSHVVYTPEPSLTGEVVGFVAVHTDITLRKKAELDATRARDEALRAGRAKDDFLAALSHELRTPLNPVLLLASEAARNDALPPAIREDFNTIAKNVQLEARLIDDLLDLTRITRGKMSLDLQTVDVHAVMRDALDNVRADLQAQSLTLDVALNAPRSQLTGDPARLQQVFWNVLKNAVKFTPPGGRIRVETASGPYDASLSITISDTGIGLSGDELPRIFNSFEQGDHSQTSDSHRFGGLGLGLSISRRLVELHAGTISAASTGRGQGSTFSIQLPFTSAPHAATQSRSSRSPIPATVAPVPTAESPAAPILVLLVEDHTPTRIALTQLLTRRKYTVTSAATVAEALDAAARQSFAFVISDIGLPDGNGYKLMATLRDRHGLRGIALSGYGMEQDIAQGRVAGFITHLIKPVDVRTLENALAKMP